MITAKEIANYIINSDANRFEDDRYYVNVDDNGELSDRYKDRNNSFSVDVDPDITEEWADDETPERFYREFETIDNPDFMRVCEALADKLNRVSEDM